MKLYSINILSIILLIMSSFSVFAQERSGNYLDSRIGDTKNETYEALLYHADKEWLYDFDTKSPFEGITISSGTFERDKTFFMSSPQSMKWNTSKGASLLFNANVTLEKSWPNNYYLTLGMFQEDVPKRDDKRVFKVELLSVTGDVIISRDINMHRGGWNILCSDLKLPSTVTVDKVRITQISGVSGAVLLDNFMISAFQNNNIIFMANGTAEIGNAELTMDKANNYPETVLTEDEKQAFLSIAEKVIPLPEKINQISSEKLQEYKEFHDFYNIVSHGEYASGKNPLYYWRSVTSEVTNLFIHYVQNEKLCKKLKEIGKAWYQTEDAIQKKELSIIMTDLIRLAVTFGDMPNPWYNGRGFAEGGVYYAKDLLQEAGLLDRVTTLIMQQYGVDLVLFNDQKWDNPLGGLKGPLGPEFFWQATADHLNTTSKSMILSVLVGANTPEKARNLKRFKSWLDNIALTYSPGVDGTLKPDGSWFHHWGESL
ncbi:hypothetical protein JCM19274_2791 [Algibacter lectus]|uniref:Lyase catalytic domain-containing protein n=1 Tax=Algibacter lectus TaxID=221126 RepID=A0A090WYA8_9FLAO|nr:chondroitinase family polysaccharide lyase [Algibacter lectus]GAL82080.1 hypothetical protein JCM19274_2791 [Algibacter lectus]